MTTDARFLENPFPDRVRNLAILRRGAISNEVQKKRPCVANVAPIFAALNHIQDWL
jgi:hypothetical protein